MSYQPPPAGFDPFNYKANEAQSNPVTNNGSTDIAFDAFLRDVNAPPIQLVYGAVAEATTAGSGMPPYNPSSIPITSNVSGGQLVNGVGDGVEVNDSIIVESHITDGYLRNCKIYGGAFTDCSFKSCLFYNVKHCYESKLDDCTVVGGGTTLVACAHKRSELAGAILKDCKVRTD
eukprot:GILI01025874.1.p1 GENE.GILI01025874.1~~GILI01025874.1.p1  ORF type:complete len:189 (-),score=14.29 GILI01025874.1:47-571(-)